MNSPSKLTFRHTAALPQWTWHLSRSNWCQKIQTETLPEILIIRGALSPFLKRIEGLILAHFLDDNPILPLGWNIKFLSRYLYGFVCIGSLNCSKTFGARPEDIDTPASDLS